MIFSSVTRLGFEHNLWIYGNSQKEIHIKKIKKAMKAVILILSQF